MKNCYEVDSDQTIANKKVHIFSSKFDYVVVTIGESNDLSAMIIYW